MDETDEKEMIWAAGLANKLRVVQANWADEDPATRQEYIEEGIEEALNEVPPEDRLKYLKTLAKKFPDWQSQEPTPVIRKKEEEPRALTPKDLIEQLLQQASRLTEEKRREYAKMLHQEGFTLGETKSGEKEAFEEMPAELSKRLRLPAGKELNIRLVIQLLTHLMEMVLTLDQLVWNMWPRIAPRSRIRRQASSDLRTLSGRYLTGDPDVSLAQVTQALERSRQLLAGLLGAIGPVGRSYSRRHAAKYSPAAIQDLVRMEPGKIWDSVDVRCWRKYTELAKDLTEEAVEKQIHEAIVEHTEELMAGSTRSSKNPS